MRIENSVKTVFLIALMTGIFIVVGNIIGGRNGAILALALSAVMNLVMYWFSDKIVLAMHRAKPIGPGHPSGVHEIVQDLSMRAGLPMPRVYIVPDATPNAFATGRDPAHSAVAVTDGIARLLSPSELRGVLAHEMSHIKNRDILITTLVAALASAIMHLAYIARWAMIFGGVGGRSNDRDDRNPLVFLFAIVMAPIAAAIVQMWISRTREYEADASAARLTADPESLASALERISDPSLMQRIARMGGLRQPAPAFNHLYIVNNFSGGAFFTLFSTPPPLAERVRRLREMITGVRIG